MFFPKELFVVIEVAIVTVLFAPDPLQAQEMGLFRLGRWGGSLRLRLEREKKNSPSISSRPYFYEGLSIKNQGYIIDPKLFYFRFDGDLKLFQEKFIAGEVTQRSHGRLLSYSFNSLLLKEHPYPLVFLSTRTSNTVDLDFGGIATYDIHNLEATLSLRGIKLPSTIKVKRERWQEIWSRAGWTTQRDEIRKTLRYDGQRKTRGSALDVRFEYTDLNDRIIAERGYKTSNGKFLYHKNFGKGNRNLWNNNLYYYARKGWFNITSYGLNETLSLRHGHGLSSYSRYSLSSTQVGGENSFTQSGVLSLSHQLYASLTTSLGLSGTLNKFPRGGEKTYWANFASSYTKSIPLQGRLEAGYGLSYGENDRDAEGQLRWIIHERHVFRKEFPILLFHPRVILTSIVVTDESRTIFYEEGANKDYVVQVIGERVEIYRNPLGRIEEGQRVLVDYQYKTSPSMRYSTVSRQGVFSLTFPWLNLYYRYSSHDQNLLAGAAENKFFLEDILSSTAGIELRWFGGEIKTSLSGEYSTYESRALSYNALSFNQSFSCNPIHTILVSIKSSQFFLEHAEDKRQLRVYLYKGFLYWRTSINLFLRAFGGYRIRMETGTFDESSYEFGVEARWNWRALELASSYEQRLWEVDKRQIYEKRLTLEVKRQF